MCSSALRMPFKRRGSWSIDLHSIMYLSSCHHRPMHYAEELMLRTTVLTRCHSVPRMNKHDGGQAPCSLLGTTLDAAGKAQVHQG